MRRQACVNRFVLDFLRHGPAQLDDLYRSAFQWDQTPRGMVDGALMHFSVKRLKHEESGTRYVELPDNLVAIWWACPAVAAQRFARVMHGPTAA